MSKIKSIVADQIQDSRGNPTIQVKLETEKGVFMASVPSGASTGKNEALELRDPDGKGVTKAIENINKIIFPKLKNKNTTEQKALDELMISLDGSENKSKLGANAILSVSIAICRAGAASEKLPLYKYIAKLSDNYTLHIPLPMFNILEGGVHTENPDDTSIQEFMVVPQKKSFVENLMLGNKVFNNLKDILTKTYGQNLQIGFEGGFATPIKKAEQALILLKNAIDNLEANIATDCAASEFYRDGKYLLDGEELTRNDLLEFYKDLSLRFPFILIEDPFSQEDIEGFKEIKKALPDILIVGDDLTTTNTALIKRAHNSNACNGVILKVNQIGTVSETIEASKLAKSYAWKTIVSHRSGETMDDFIADFAVGVGSDFIKSGSPTQPERMAKYQRLLEIENELKKP